MRNKFKKKQNNNKKYIVETGKIFLRKALIFLVVIFLLSFTNIIPVTAEGSSAKVFLSLSRDTLNIGKTFSLTLKVTPDGTNIAITNFQATIQYDTSRFDLIMEDGSPKITRPASVPPSPKYAMGASVSGNQITAICSDETTALNSPIQTKGETALITFTLKVKDNATIGQASFLILGDCVINQQVNYTPIAVPLTIISPKTAPVAARLDTNANLSELRTDTGTLTPAFSKTVTAYTLSVPMDKTSVVITAKQESALAKFVIAGGATLAYGNNKVTVTVTAQDPDVVKVYTVTVNRASPAASSVEESSSEETSMESSSESASESDSESEVSSLPPESASSSSSEPLAPANTELAFWKFISFLFIGLFAVTAGALAWLLIRRFQERGGVVRKVRGQDEVVKIKRLK